MEIRPDDRRRRPTAAEHVEYRVVASKIRYAVLCYGVPLKIAPTRICTSWPLTDLQPELRRNEAAVDSELAWLPLIRNERRRSPARCRTGFMAPPTPRCSIPPTAFCWSRGSTARPPDIARGLVDKALEAERDGLWGRAYFDARGLTNEHEL